MLGKILAENFDLGFFQLKVDRNVSFSPIFYLKINVNKNKEKIYFSI